MKKSLFLVASLVMMSSSAFAQWTAPTVNGTDMVAGDTLYLYNKEAHGFLLGANDWSTRASVGEKGYKVIIKHVYEDEEQTVDMGTFLICDSVETQSAVKAMFADNAQSIWVDNLSGANVDKWKITKLENGAYEITNSGLNDLPLGVAEKYEGKTGNTRLWLKDTSLTYKDADTQEDFPIFEGEFYNEWLFVSPEEYAEVQPKLAQYLAAVSLGEALETAKASFPTCDFSAVEATYNNTNSTVEELNAAKEQITTIENEYKASLASFDEPTDFTSVIGDGSAVDPWTREFTGTGTPSDAWHTNTWSTEANNGGDGTDMVTPFCEAWIASGGKLADQKIYQVLKSAAPGLYKFTANVRLYNEAGGVDALTGCTMFFGDNTVTLDEQVDMYKSGSKCVLWNKNKFNIIAIVKESGDVEFGFDVKDATFNWMAFKETSLLYYGNKDVEANATKLFKQAYNFEKAGEDVDANAEVIAAYNNAVDAFDAAATIDDAKAVLSNVLAAETALDDNVTAYKNLTDKIASWEAASSEGTDKGLAGEYWDNFSDFMTISTDDADEISEDYPRPVPSAISAGDRSLTTDEINAYITKVDELYAYAVAHSLTEGADCTDMLVNPSFKDGFSSWTKADGKSTPTGNVGGLDICKDVEVYENVVYVQQVVNDVPDGIYSLSCQAFERPAANGSFDGSEDSKVFLFMNDFQTPVQNICKDAVSEDAVQNLSNCYLAAEADATTGTGSWPYDYNVSGIGWIPNSMDGASYAFAAGRYTQKVYGLIDNGTMTIGLTSNNVTAHWVLWANFTLTYEGKNAEAIMNVLPTYTEQLKTYLDNNAEGMTKSSLAKYQEILSNAEDLSKDDDADVLMTGLQNVNKAMTDAKASVEAYAAYLEANTNLENAALTYGETMSEKATAAYYAVDEARADDNVAQMDNDQLAALTAQINDAIALMKVPNTKDVSDDNPIDFTGVINNPDFTEGNANGWTYAFETITNIGYQGANYTNTPEEGDPVTISQFIEGWRSGNAAIGDGSIEQTIANLPAGTYKLGVDAIANLQSISDDTWQTEVNGIYLFAEEVATAAESSNRAKVVASDNKSAVEIRTANGAPEHFEVVFKKNSDDTNVIIGLQALSATANWIAADNFTLTYYGTSSVLEPEADATAATAISNIASEKAAPAAIFTISGARSNTLVKGINIVRMADGTVKKIMVK